jgi:hypothetical protein
MLVLENWTMDNIQGKITDCDAASSKAFIN